MNQDFIEGQTDLELVEVDSVVDSLSTWIELGAEGIVTFFSSDEVSDVLDEIKELGTELSNALKVVKVIRKSASIPNKLFMRKMERYCAGLVSIPASKREKYVKRVGKESLNKDSVFILGVLNKIEELSKIDILLRLFEAKMDEEIKRRLLQLYKKYNYSIPEGYKRVKNLLAMVEGYVPDGMVDQEMVILGYTCDNVIYKKEEK